MSGFEVAGVVLAVLPLFIGACKSYSNLATTLPRAVTPSARNKELEEFYSEMYWNTYELRKNIVDLVEMLPNLADERKKEVILSRDLDNWDQAQDIAAALQDFLSADDHEAFHMVMVKVLELLSRLIKDSTVHISKRERDPRRMLEKLQKLKDDRAANITSANFLERFKFLKEERRGTYQKSLSKWNKRLSCIVGARQAANTRKAVMLHHEIKGPSSHLRMLSKRLFGALWRCWSCDCDTPHEARFCIATCGSKGNNDLARMSTAFDFLISHHQTGWYESTVVIDSTKITAAEGYIELQKICDAITSRRNTTRHCIQLLVEDSQSPQKIWRLNMREAQHRYPEPFPAISFESLLSRPMPSLVERRRLALTFAYSLMQLHESPWLSDQWENKRMHFFRMESGDPDLERPFLSASFDRFPHGPEPVDLDRFHRNSGILRLGILLIEVHNWKPLESFRYSGDLLAGQPTPNTDLAVARRVLKTLKSSCLPTYMSAIEACLSVPWVPSGNTSRVSLDDVETWSGTYLNIVKPLEMEVDLCNFMPTL